MGTSRAWWLSLALMGVVGAAASAQPANDACASATPALSGATTTGDVTTATSDGDSSCNGDFAPDVYHTFVPPVTGTYTFSLCAGTAWDSVISLHSGCPASQSNEIACDDDGCRPPGATDAGYASSLTVQLPAGVPYIIRISTYDSGTTPGAYSLLIVGPAAASGGCCLGTTCSIQTAAVCQTAGATYRGNYTACVAPLLVPSTYASATTTQPIPDNTPAGIISTITVPDVFTVGEIQLSLTLNHTFCGDLTVLLSHGGQTVALFDHIGGGLFGDDSNFGGLYTFSDAGTDTIWQSAVDNAAGTTAVVPVGVHRACNRYANTNSLRAAFAGVAAAGDWSINISDNSEFDTGTFGGWSLTLDRNAGNPCGVTAGACCFGSSCNVQLQNICTGVNHRFIGSGTACNAPGDLRAPCCKADFNQNSAVTVQDIFDYLNAYFTQQPTADTNGAGVSIQDLFDFLTAYFSNCA